MILCDVNVFIHAHKEGTERHAEFLRWLTDALEGDEAFGVSDQVLSSVVRVVTNRRAFDPPSSLDEALEFVESVRTHPNAVGVAPGQRHWEIFARLCRQSGAKGNLMPDAYLAALAIESGCEWITTDRDYARFLGLRWRHPLS
ncbi:MAG: PIN domain-containing protein [Streptosporangiales bacterium]|nr:PIN domain-containing protein [Streptosporangiales bacterium]